MAPRLAGVIPFGLVIGISAAPIVVVAATLISTSNSSSKGSGYDC